MVISDTGSDTEDEETEDECRATRTLAMRGRGTVGERKRSYCLGGEGNGRTSILLRLLPFTSAANPVLMALFFRALHNETSADGDDWAGMGGPERSANDDANADSIHPA